MSNGGFQIKSMVADTKVVPRTETYHIVHLNALFPAEPIMSFIVNRRVSISSYIQIAIARSSEYTATEEKKLMIAPRQTGAFSESHHWDVAL